MKRSLPISGRALVALAALLAASVIAAPALATVMLEVPMERLVAESDLVVHGRVRDVGSRLVANAEGHFEPHTVTVLEVLEVLAGAPAAVVSAPRELVVDEIGGRVQDQEMRIVGTPEYRRGEEVVVFLRALPDGGYRTYAMAQGHFEVLQAVGAAQPVVVRDTRAITMARWANGQMSLDHGQRAEMPLAVFLQYVRELAVTAGGVR